LSGAALRGMVVRIMSATHTHPTKRNLTARLERAAQNCVARGSKLTQIRRDVLALVLSAGEPVGAYALLDRLRAQTGQGQPPTIYRALEFLLEQGLIHKIERLNAFVPCQDECDHPHPVQFFICRQCGAATEIEDAAIAQAVAAAAARNGFVVGATMVEVDGVCAKCAARPA